MPQGRDCRGLRRHLRQHAGDAAAELVRRVGKPDLIIDATGNSAVAFEAMEVLGHNGVVGLDQHHRRQAVDRVPADK